MSYGLSMMPKSGATKTGVINSKIENGSTTVIFSAVEPFIMNLSRYITIVKLF